MTKEKIISNFIEFIKKDLKLKCTKEQLFTEFRYLIVFKNYLKFYKKSLPHFDKENQNKIVEELISEVKSSLALLV